ncbi:hypothetical protein M8J77_019891 [Diaphorina citri]|nr:hypothetical protein M8J77_019891 [Diaphorina citri]
MVKFVYQKFLRILKKKTVKDQQGTLDLWIIRPVYSNKTQNVQTPKKTYKETNIAPTKEKTRNVSTNIRNMFDLN